MPVICEGLMTTLLPDGSTNLAPMGPEICDDWQRLILRPYCTSTTYANLKRTGEGIFHVTDNAELLAQAAVGTATQVDGWTPAIAVRGVVLANACRWYALKVTLLDDSEERTRIETKVVDSGIIREFFGFNRAKHAVVEAAILATRVGLLNDEEIRAAFLRLEPLIEKTGGDAERRAFELLRGYLNERLPGGLEYP